MPLYRFNLISLGRVIGSQEQECTDDHAAVAEQYDGLEIGPSNSRWVELYKVDPRTKQLLPVHAE